jgi:hypothetical protein
MLGVVGDDGGLGSLSSELALAHERVSRLRDDATRSRLARRLIAITNAAKHDAPSATRRLRALLRSLDDEPGDAMSVDGTDRSRNAGGDGTAASEGLETPRR